MDAGRVLRVLVTRPEPGAGATAGRLAEAGFLPLILPLTAVVPLPPASPAAQSANAVAATSANALRLAAPALLAPLLEKSLFAVGAATAEAARDAGFRTVEDAGSDAAGLARLVLSRPGIRRLAYLCGRVRRPDFETVLRANGIGVHAIETYDTLPAELAPKTGAVPLGPAPIDAALLYSAEGARAFAGLVAQPQAKILLAATALFALSPRIAAALPVSTSCFVAPAPNEESLLALLCDWREKAARTRTFPALQRRDRNG